MTKSRIHLPNKICSLINIEQRGVTLIEMMVAMVIGLFISGSVISIYISNKKISQTAESFANIQEKGRIVIEILSNEIRQSDFWGCTSIANVTNNLNPGTSTPDFSAGGIGGLEGASGAPDTLILRGAFDAGLTIQAPYMATPAANLRISTPNTLSAGDIVLVSDCTSGDIFQISAGTPSTNGVVVHNTGTGTPGNYAANPAATCPGGGSASMNCLSAEYTGSSQLLRATQITYTIADNPNGVPSLYRNTNGVDQELIPGVEDLQIRYGEDTTGDQIADQYLSATDVADFGNVVNIEFSLLVRSRLDNITSNATSTYYVGTSRPAADKRLRRAYTTTVNIRNRTLNL